MLGLSLTVLFVGCGPTGPELHPVSGRVLIDGEPVPHGFVRVMPSGYRAAHGKLDREGRFELSTYAEGDGCVSGEHAVTVTALEMLPGQSQRWHAPKKYAEATTAGLAIEVDGPTDDIEINLTWAGGKPFVETFSGSE